MKFSYNTSLPFLNSPKDTDLSYNMDGGFWDCFGFKKKNLSYSRRNMVLLMRSHSVNIFREEGGMFDGGEVGREEQLLLFWLTFLWLRLIEILFEWPNIC